MLLSLSTIKDIKAIGCYSQGQAHRIGKRALLSEQNLTETCQFSVALESGIVLRPGMVIDVADPVRAGERVLVESNLQQQHRSRQIAAMT